MKTNKFIKENKTPTDFEKNLSGVFFGLLRRNYAFLDRRGRRSLQGKIKHPYEKSAFARFLFYEKEQDEEENKVVKAVAAVGEEQDQGEDEKLLRADTAVLAEKRAEPQTKSAL